MPPSSLIFVVIIAIWAAYLLQHWVRRREHLATARSVDRFSEAMRVLERRPRLPEVDLSTPQPRSYLVSPARQSRPEVVVKRAVPSAPVVSSRTPESEDTTEPTSATSSGPATTGPATTGPATPKVRSTRIFRALNGVTARRIRGVSFLVCLVGVPAVALLAFLGRLPWYAVGIAFAALVADVVMLRWFAQRERAARRAARSAARPSYDLHSSTRSADAARPAAPAAKSPAARARESVLARGAMAARRADASPDSELDGDSDRPGGWQPVPVPPPTYTLKAKAVRPTPVAEPDGDDTQEMPMMDEPLRPTVVASDGSDERRAANA